VVEIDGLGVYTVSDRMGWSSTQMLDVWTPDCADAIAWGVRFLQVRVVSS
jgi:3D (Asp-Asp-Asp) domain-containing protein